MTKTQRIQIKKVVAVLKRQGIAELDDSVMGLVNVQRILKGILGED